MLSKQFKILCATFSLFLTSCGTKAPPVTVCLLVVNDQSCFCAYPSGDAKKEPLEKCDGFLAMPPEDLDKLMQFFKRNKAELQLKYRSTGLC